MSKVNTIFNTSKCRVYYKPEEDGKVNGPPNPEGIEYNKENAAKFFVEPGGSISFPIDGVATSLHKNMVYKVPDGAGVIVYPDGKVKMVCIPAVTKDFALCNMLETLPDIVTDKFYKYKWMTKIDFDGKLYSWEFLFNMAEKIECPIASPTTPLEDINKPNFQQQDKTKVAPKSKYEQILEAGQQQYKAAEELRQYDGGDIPDNPSGWNKNTKKSSGTIKIDRQRVLI